MLPEIWKILEIRKWKFAQKFDFFLWGKWISGRIVHKSAGYQKLKKLPSNFFLFFRFQSVIFLGVLLLIADAYVSGPDLAPQKMKLGQKFRHLMRCKNILTKFVYHAKFLRNSCLFTFLAKIQNGRQKSEKGCQSIFLLLPITKKWF